MRVHRGPAGGGPERHRRRRLRRDRPPDKPSGERVDRLYRTLLRRQKSPLGPEDAAVADLPKVRLAVGAPAVTG